MYAQRAFTTLMTQVRFQDFFCLQTEEKGPSGLVSHETVLASVECRFVHVNEEGRFRLSYAIDDSP
jgi:uncharacterized membrane protein